MFVYSSNLAVDAGPLDDNDALLGGFDSCIEMERGRLPAVGLTYKARPFLECGKRWWWWWWWWWWTAASAASAAAAAVTRDWTGVQALNMQAFGFGTGWD